MPRLRRLQMAKKRQKHSSEFKAKIALLAIRGEITVAQICSKHKVDSSQVNRWKKEALDNMASVFNKKNDTELQEIKDEVDILYKQIGKITIQNEFLREKLFP